MSTVAITWQGQNCTTAKTTKTHITVYTNIFSATPRAPLKFLTQITVFTRRRSQRLVFYFHFSGKRLQHANFPPLSWTTGEHGLFLSRIRGENGSQVFSLKIYFQLKSFNFHCTGFLADTTSILNYSVDPLT